ncbi:MAG: tetratricopeptide repeat protein [Planctomycetota bacterium]|nr:tetratricopeptide repeat protein [Planctomycetota bacterium]
MTALLALLLSLSLQDGTSKSQERAPVLDRSPLEWVRAEEGAWSGWDPVRSGPPTEAARAPLRRALEAVERRDLTAALDAWFALLEVEPDYPPALYQAGVVYFRLRRYSDAALAFERFLSVAPQRLPDTRALGHCHYSLGRYEEAAAHYERVLVLGETPGLLFGLGLARLRLGEEESAQEHLERVIELNPAHQEAHTWLAQLHFDAGRAEEARVSADRAKGIDPFTPRPWFLLARVLLELGEDDEADEAHSRFKSLERTAQEVRTLKGRLLYKPYQPSLHARLVELHVAVRNVKGARAALSRWEALDPLAIGSKLAGLAAWELLKLPDQAEVAAAALAEVAGDSVDAWAALARYYRLTRDRVRQVSAEQRWLELSRAR